MTPAGDPRAVIRSVQHALSVAPSFHQLDPGTRDRMTSALNDIGGVLGATPIDLAATALADPPPGAGSRGGPGTAAGGPTGRVGELARATLNAIDFPSFVSALIKGTFQAIVDSTIQQMEAYATMLAEVAKTVDDYMEDNVSEGAAKDYLADRYGDVFVKNTTGGTPTLDIDRSNPTQPLPSFFSNLGFDNAAQLDPNSVEEVIVPAARKTIAEQRHQTLATMVLMGLSRIVVDDGEINAKLEFHIDASETMDLAFDNTQTSMGTMAGVSGGATFSGNGIMVNTTNVNAQTDLNVRADLTGEVRVRFSTDYLPLERFADSNAIQLINQHATVPTTPEPASDATNGIGADDTVEQQSISPTSVAARSPALDPWSPQR